MVRQTTLPHHLSVVIITLIAFCKWFYCLALCGKRYRNQHNNNAQRDGVLKERIETLPPCWWGCWPNPRRLRMTTGEKQPDEQTNTVLEPDDAQSDITAMRIFYRHYRLLYIYRQTTHIRLGGLSHPAQ